MSYEPGTYVKGDRTRYAETKADAVAAVFEGYVLQDAPESEQAPAEEPKGDEPKVSEDEVDGVGTLGGGDFSEDDTPSVPSTPTPASVFKR